MDALRHLRRQLKPLVGTVLVAAFLTGCGGGSGGETRSSAPLTKEAFVKRGNSLCDKLLEERDVLTAKAYRKFTAEGGFKTSSKSSRDRLANQVAGQVILVYKKLVHELRELEPPARDARTVDEILSNYESTLDHLGGDSRKLRKAEPLAPNREASAYGLVSCGL